MFIGALSWKARQADPFTARSRTARTAARSAGPSRVRVRMASATASRPAASSVPKSRASQAAGSSGVLTGGAVARDGPPAHRRQRPVRRGGFWYPAQRNPPCRSYSRDAVSHPARAGCSASGGPLSAQATPPGSPGSRLRQRTCTYPKMICVSRDEPRYLPGEGEWPAALSSRYASTQRCRPDSQGRPAESVHPRELAVAGNSYEAAAPHIYVLLTAPGNFRSCRESGSPERRGQGALGSPVIRPGQLGLRRGQYCRPP